MFFIRPSLDDDAVSCTCCAGMPGVRGSIEEGGKPIAVYVVEPTGRAFNPSLRLGIVLGPWRDDSLPQDRLAAAFFCQPGRAPVPVDAFRPVEILELGTPLMASETQAHPDFDKFLALASAVIAQDSRLGEMRRPAAGEFKWPEKFLADDQPG